MALDPPSRRAIVLVRRPEESPVEIAGTIALLFFLAFVVLAVLATVRTVRAVKRGVERGTVQARRVIEDNRLRARRYTLPGVAGELVQLRLDLRRSIDATFSALADRHPEDASLAEAAALLARLDDHARALDAELALLEREPDKARLSERLPSLTDRTRRITHSADSLRWAARDRVRRLADDDLAALTRQIDIESSALRHWTPPPQVPADPNGPPRKLSPPEAPDA
ncbi:hypothetical protein [Streptomyces sp.]|uniref:hypothetical protein n=1 Tax=Streptomyces sp. TaxID=1931 RepID=UPI002F411ACA